MAEASGIRAGKAFVELALKSTINKQLDGVLAKCKGVGQGISDIGKKAAGIGAAITAPLIAAAKLSADSGAALYDMSRRTGISAEALSTFGYVADRTGSDINVVEGAVRRMQKSIAGVADAAEGTSGKLDDLGLSAADVAGKSPDEQFRIIAKAISEISDPTARAAAAMGVFGRSGTQLLPMIEDFDKLAKRAKDLGFVRSTQSVKEAKDLEDALYDVSRATKGVVSAMVSGIIPVLKEKAEKMLHATIIVRDFVKSHKDLVVIVFKAATILGLAGTALVFLGQGVKLLSPAFSILASTIGFLLNPIVLVSAGLVALAAYFLYTTGAGAKLLAWLGDRFEILRKTATEAFGGIADALSAGDMLLAAQILWTGLKLAWLQGTQELQAKWAHFKGEMVKAAIEAFYGILDAWAIVSASLQKAWANTTSAISEVWHSAIIEATKYFDFIDQAARDKEKLRIQNKLNDPNLAPNVRKMLERQLQNVDEQGDQAKAARDRKDEEEALKRQQDLKAKIAAIDAERDKKLKENVDAERGLTSAVDQVAKQEAADLEKQKAALQAELDAMRKKAAAESEAKKKATADGKAPTLIGTDKLKSFLDSLANQAKRVDQDSLKTSAAGLFNVNALQSLQGTAVQDRIVKAAEATAKNTKDMLRELTDDAGGLTFN